MRCRGWLGIPLGILLGICGSLAADERGLEPESTYFSLLEQHFAGGIRCPLHKPARRAAGFTESELGRLEALCKKS